MPNLSAAMAAREDDAALVQVTELAICAAKHALNGIFFGFTSSKDMALAFQALYRCPAIRKSTVDEWSMTGTSSPLYMRRARNG